MVSRIFSVLVITGLPVICVVISIFYSSSFDIGQYQEKLLGSSYFILCSLPYKNNFMDSKRCDSSFDSEKWKTNFSSMTDLHNEQDQDNTNQTLLEAYSEFDTFMLGLLKDENDQQLKEKGYRDHGFNLFASDRIGLWRNAPDTRNVICRNKMMAYKEALPSASIVMCFYNEAWSTLLRSVHSILSRTPMELIKEIILLDDDSSFGHLKSPLDEYIEANFSNVKIIHSPIRLGLIRARMEGAKYATGEVLIFLDSHIEVGQDWLPPLLDRIARNRKNVVIPVIDTIEGETMIYKKANLVRGGFTWSLLHNWEQLPLDVLRDVEVTSDPFISPTMPGGLFAMEKNYFYELGEYDGGMNIWGGENMEISFRIWQCGGRLEVVPCSRIGHVFRQFRPYTAPNGQDTATRNAARVAQVWLDDYKRHFFDHRPGAQTMDYGDVSDRVALRERLGCKSFHWFLETIHPEQGGSFIATKGFKMHLVSINKCHIISPFTLGKIVPGEKPKVPGAYFRPIQRPKPNILSVGLMRHKKSDLCCVPDKDPPVKGTVLLLEKCDLVKQGSGRFVTTSEHLLKLSDKNLCLDIRGKKQEVYLMKCASGGSQTWLQIAHEGHQVLYNPLSGKCLSVNDMKKGSQLSLDFCSRSACQKFVVE